ncbi:MAG: hypothetical protein ACRD06_07060, partial [Terriglobia bacterium]
MPLYVITPDALKPDRVYENGPAIALVTDAKLEAEIPAALRDASDRVITGDLSWLRNARIPEGYDTAILWVAGDQLLRGSGASIRCMVADAAHRTLVPVHLNGASSDELDLIGLQPRIWKKGPDAECIRQHVRIR